LRTIPFPALTLGFFIAATWIDLGIGQSLPVAGAGAAKRAVVIDRSGPEGTRGGIALLHDAFPGVDPEIVQGLAGALERAGWPVRLLSGQEVADPKVLRAERFSIYIVPEIEVYPASGARALATYLSGGGHLVALGGPAFQRPVWLVEGRWLDRATIRGLVSRVATERVLFDFEGQVKGWAPLTDNAGVAAGLESVGEGAGGTGRSVRIWTDRLEYSCFAPPGRPVSPGP
jgi:hypothetical protein